VFSLLLTVGLLYKIASGLSARLAEIVEVLGHSRIGDYSHRIDRGLGDDIGRVAHNVNLLLSSSAQREKRVLESALSDPLTGLPNRTLLTERLRHMLALSRRQPTPFAIGVIDLDRFKFVNDTLGHAAGDTVLVEVARRLRATVRDSDTVARLGGDEFVLLLTGGEATVRVEDHMRIVDPRIAFGPHLLEASQREPHRCLPSQLLVPAQDGAVQRLGDGLRKPPEERQT
jgi:GGDEF domain-containing protein